MRQRLIVVFSVDSWQGGQHVSDALLDLLEQETNQVGQRLFRPLSHLHGHTTCPTHVAVGLLSDLVASVSTLHQPLSLSHCVCVAETMSRLEYCTVVPCCVTVLTSFG